MPRDEELHQFFAEVFEERLQRSPMLQTQLGREGADHLWDDFSDAAAHAHVASSRQHLARLREDFGGRELATEDRISYRLLERELELEIEGEQWLYHSYPVNQEHGLQAELPDFLISTHEVATVDDARSYIARLRGLDVAIEQIVAGMRLRTSKGIVPPRFVYPQVLRDIDNLLTGEPFGSTEGAKPETAGGSPLWEDLKAKVQELAVPAEMQDKLLAEGRDALLRVAEPAFRQLRAATEEQAQRAEASDGVWKLPRGEEYYRYTLRLHTTTDLDADTIHEMGLAEVARIHDDLRSLMRQVGFSGDLLQFFDSMAKGQEFLLPDTDAGRAEYLQKSQAAIDRMQERLPEFFITLPKAQLVLRRVEPFREASGGIAYYQQAALDGSRPAIYYTNLYRMAERPVYNIETIAYHEAIPGHHMQVSIAQELESLPTFRRLAGYTAFDEGWALYAELLGKEMGGFEDPYSDFGRLSEELWRACRLVVDTGIHARRWTRQQAIDYHLANTPNALGTVVKETERYIVLPGQATSYKVGMAKILELRALAEQRLGRDFDLRAFHDVVLTHGSVPLDVLQDNVMRWLGDR